MKRKPTTKTQKAMDLKKQNEKRMEAYMSEIRIAKIELKKAWEAADGHSINEWNKSIDALRNKVGELYIKSRGL